MLSPEEVLALVPQQPPYRFIDRIVELDEKHCVAEYRFREDEFFYRGHFPGNPVTPGAILTETMAQCALVVPSIYLLGLEISIAEMADLLALFTDSSVAFDRVVRPGDLVRVNSKTQFWRRWKIKAEVIMTLPDETIVASGTMAGLVVKRERVSPML